MKTTHSCQTQMKKITPKLGLLGIGTEVMRQFDEGLLVGTVQSYDRKESLYKILYSDGDMEDMDEEEYVYAYQLALANGGDANNLSSRDSADEESAYQLPKKKVNFIFVLHLLCLNLRLSSSSKPKRHECEVRSGLGSHVPKSCRYVVHITVSLLVLHSFFFISEWTHVGQC